MKQEKLIITKEIETYFTRPEKSEMRNKTKMNLSWIIYRIAQKRAIVQRVEENRVERYEMREKEPHAICCASFESEAVDQKTETGIQSCL